MQSLLCAPQESSDFIIVLLPVRFERQLNRFVHAAYAVIVIAEEELLFFTVNDHFV